MNGIYKSNNNGSYKYFAGSLDAAGEPKASSPAVWDGYWFKTKKGAQKYLEALKKEPEIADDLAQKNGGK